MKRVFVFWGLILSVTAHSQVIQNNTIYNVSAFVKCCCRDMKLDSCLIMIRGDNIEFKYGLKGQSSEIDKGYSYNILLDKGLSFNETLFVLAHELVHVKQLKCGDLRFNQDSIHFHDIVYPNNARNHNGDLHELSAARLGTLLYEKNRGVLILYD